MYKFPIGVIIDGFKTDRTTAIEHAARLGVDGIQMFATKGVNSPENLDSGSRKTLKKQVNDAGLVFSALCGDMGMGFGDSERNPVLIQKLKKILDLANDLGTNIVTTHIGVVPDSDEHERYKTMQEACSILAEYAYKNGSYLAIETGPERSTTLLRFIESLDSKGIAINFDPANLRMVIDEDPIEAVKNLAKYIVHTHAKDGIMLNKGNPEFIYRVVHPIPPEVKAMKFFEERPLGEGAVNFTAYLQVLEEIGYKGFLTVEREAGLDPVANITQAVDFLKKQVR
ncbi:MAG: sugar phosphate isomerase/epimerase [Clostridia bacterium]|nr:sugar phosphate isomerase/epimerase [Clostridia bacterium]